MHEPSYWHTWKGNTCYNVISLALHRARTYPVATQKGMTDLCLYQLATMHVQMHVAYIPILRFSHNVANKAACTSSKHDDQDTS